MATVGRKKLPKAIKEKRGTLDARYCVENEMEVGIVTELSAPGEYDERKKQLWTKYTAVLAENGILSEIDYEAIVMLCNAIALYEQMYKFIQKHGATVETKQGSRIRAEYKVMQDSAETALKIGVRFGITPSGRASIDVKPRKKDAGDDLFTI